ncbi:YceI family protein [Tenacibaculum sp. MAR_2009_124]|uniref:YceI family protein n=1 Tax=Tenacibaculum sp. MAR_2009_124 TaxID=1250059 RepID=UPI0021017B38|nr:YceI family protein [Tenacibaculum sp. MAR_2009_124]
MKIKITVLVFLFITSLCFSQKLFTRTGITEFKASIDAFEAVEAINKSTSVIVNSEGKIAAQLYISAFSFKVALMQEHFNENYMESDEFPKANFKGTIEQFDIGVLKDSYILKGSITVKGISKSIETKVKIKKSANDKIVLKGVFAVSPKDFNIKIPSIVRKKIAEHVTISLDYELSKKK